MIPINKIKDYSTEQLIDYINSNKIKKNSVVNIIKKSNLSNTEVDELVYKVNVSYKRINESLEFELKLFYLFFPFGIVTTFLPNHDQDIQRFEKFRFIKKIKQYYLYSLIGSIAYILIGLILGTFF